MNTKILFLTAYDIKKHGGVQNQIKLLSDKLTTLNYETEICSPNSDTYNLGKAMNIPFNKSIAPISLFPNRKV